ncbi:NAD(P)-binding protein [Pseudovirgaria hyperparasitica]|uniref:NAD(P)-binding protein n=1 Tax=Pseudovirgaria hyperparasitica TaxID=470096 RepID=A0A6A6WDI2_9PEZI|nr:NAD(P)-binding protein [Pseudovirgaria hyperparasitica]KAF2760892.1 NAD(P)-binding protein [Pseudovirgaria hyperparasitica]
MSRTQTWLITGASSGFGQSIGIAALNAGQRVVGATRDVVMAKHCNPEFAAKGGMWTRLDPGHPESLAHFAKAQEEFDVDVLVNCAGYAFIGGVEDTSEQEIRHQMEVNFYGPIRAIKAVLPAMRRKKRGHIVLISSGAGFIARPGRGVYSASKYAIEAIHESLMHETHSLGIKTLIVEPGAFRTAFSTRLVTPAAHESTGGYSEAYRGTKLEAMLQMMHGKDGVPPENLAKGDPDKAAKAIVDAVLGGHEYLRLILGPDCVKAMEDKIGEFQRDLELTREVSMGTDVVAMKA